MMIANRPPINPRGSDILVSGASCDRLLTRAEAAEYLGVSSATLATWASTGRYEIPYVKIGRCARYRVRDLDEFLDRCTRRPVLPHAVNSVFNWAQFGGVK